MSPSEHSALCSCSTCKPRSRFYLQCRQGADDGCYGSTFVRPASIDACCCGTKLVGCFCLTMNSLAPHDTAHQVQLFSGARSTRNPHPPPFDKHRFTGFCCKIEGGAQRTVPLSHYTFRKTRRMLDRCIMAIMPGIDQVVFQWETGHPILCVGSMWRNWE